MGCACLGEGFSSCIHILKTKTACFEQIRKETVHLSFISLEWGIEAGSHHITQADLKTKVLLPSLQGEVYKAAPPFPL